DRAIGRPTRARAVVDARCCGRRWTAADHAAWLPDAGFPEHPVGDRHARAFRRDAAFMGFWSTEARDGSSRHCVVAPHFAVLQVAALVLYANRVDARAAASSHPTTREGRLDPLRGLPVHRA